MVPGGLDGERQLLRTGLRQGPGRYPQERLVSGRLARERQLLHSLRIRSCEPSWQQRTKCLAQSREQRAGLRGVGLAALMSQP
jgi:hypothetical protein